MGKSKIMQEAYDIYLNENDISTRVFEVLEEKHRLQQELKECKNLNKRLFNHYEGLLTKLKNIDLADSECIKELQHKAITTLDLIELVCEKDA